MSLEYIKQVIEQILNKIGLHTPWIEKLKDITIPICIHNLEVFHFISLNIFKT